jgi:hypothetical protein
VAQRVVSGLVTKIADATTVVKRSLLRPDWRTETERWPNPHGSAMQGSPGHSMNISELKKEGAAGWDFEGQYQLSQEFELDILDPASLPKEPDSPRRWVFIVAGAVAGLVLGVGTMSVRRPA